MLLLFIIVMLLLCCCHVVVCCCYVVVMLFIVIMLSHCCLLLSCCCLLLLLLFSQAGKNAHGHWHKHEDGRKEVPLLCCLQGTSTVHVATQQFSWSEPNHEMCKNKVNGFQQHGLNVHLLPSLSSVPCSDNRLAAPRREYWMELRSTFMRTLAAPIMTLPCLIPPCSHWTIVRSTHTHTHTHTHTYTHKNTQKHIHIHTLSLSLFVSFSPLSFPSFLPPSILPSHLSHCDHIHVSSSHYSLQVS